MDKNIRYIIFFVIFITLLNISASKNIERTFSLQENVIINLYTGSGLKKTRYLVKFSTNEKKNNLNIISSVQNINI